MTDKKKFDAVEMKRMIQEKLYKETQGMTWEQEREHRRKNIAAGPLARKWKALQEQQAKQTKKAS